MTQSEELLLIEPAVPQASVACHQWHTAHQRQVALRENSKIRRYLKVGKRKARFSYLTGITVVDPAE